MTAAPRRRILVLSAQAAIVAVGFVAGFVVWRWSDGRQSESLPWFMAIWLPQSVSFAVASWAGRRIRRTP